MKSQHYQSVLRAAPGMSGSVNCTLAKSLIIWGKRERAPTCGLNGHTVTIDRRQIDVCPFTATADPWRYAQT